MTDENRDFFRIFKPTQSTDYKRNLRKNFQTINDIISKTYMIISAVHVIGHRLWVHLNEYSMTILLFSIAAFVKGLFACVPLSRRAIAPFSLTIIQDTLATQRVS